MSNIIPIVSSSPPPLDDDDDANFKWDDDDDEYGNFASAASVSAITVTSDSSIAVNWSTSETSLTPEDAPSNRTPINNDSKIYSDENGFNVSNSNCNRSENIISNNLSSHRIPPEVWSQSDDCVENNGDIQDFANFSNAEFSESTVQTASEETEKKSCSEAVSISPLQSGGADDVDAFEEDEFQEFAQFDDTLVSEKWENSSADKPELAELSQEENKTDSSNISTGHSLVQSSSQDQCLGASVPDSDSIASLHMKSNDSTYSYSSTVDSGMFSADMSPSCHPGEMSDGCLYTEKEESLTHKQSLTHQVNIPTSSSRSSIHSHEDTSLQEVSKNYRKDITSSDTIIGDTIGSENNIPSDPSSYNDGNNLVSGNINVRNKNHMTDFTNSDITEGCVRVDEGGQSGKFSDSQENYVDTGLCEGWKEVSRTTENSLVHKDGVELKDEKSIQHGTSEHDLSSSVQCDKACDLVCEDENSPNSEKHNSVSTEYKCDAENFDESVDSCESSEHVIGSVPETSLSESTETHKDVDNIVEDVEDEEFGDFGMSTSQRDDNSDDSHEVAPITFRTSICESATDDDETDDGDFTFNRERSPELDNESGSNSQEPGRTSKDNLDGEEIDDFGDFDSAQNPQNNISSNKNDDEGFGDFGKPQATDDDSGWADFGSSATPEETENSTVKQTSVAAHPEQSKVQKLRHAVISCFPDSPLQVPIYHSHIEDDQEDQSEVQSHNSNLGMSPSKEGEEFPLPLDTVVDLGLSNALEAKQQTWTVVQHPAKKDPKVRLWAHLKDVDSCHALMYGWHTSHCSKEVFTTLHIDTQNTLFTHKKQAVPFFASGLGILEPIRGGGASLDRMKEKNSLSVTHTTLLDNSKYDTQQSSVTQDIPPVDFDWSSSGLTNPLTANTLDLDFLVIQGSDSYEKTSVFKTDNQNLAPSALQPLEEILRKTTPTVKLSTNEVLSPETVRVLEKMPDLSFMQSTVLMFPVKQ